MRLDTICCKSSRDACAEMCAQVYACEYICFQNGSKNISNVIVFKIVLDGSGERLSRPTMGNALTQTQKALVTTVTILSSKAYSDPKGKPKPHGSEN